MISTRYLHTIGGIFALALIPTVMHTYVGMSHEDGRTTGAIAHQLAGFEGVATSRSPAWVKNVYESDDFIERRYGGDVTLFVARSYDLKALYHHPELAIAHGLSYDSASIAPASTPSRTVPVHVLTGSGGLAAYVLLYNGQFVENPFWFHASQAFSMLFTPGAPMTLFFAHGPGAPDALNSPVTRVVLAAVESFEAPSRGQ